MSYESVGYRYQVMQVARQDATWMLHGKASNNCHMKPR